MNDETLSLDVIHDVCNGPGHYLGHPQTLDLMNSEFHYPHTADRASRDDWEEAGALDMREKARRQAQETLQTAFTEIVPDAVDRRLRAEFDIHLPRDVMRPGGYP